MSFNKVLAGLGLTVSLIQPVHAGLPNGVASGDTSQTSTVLWARSALSGNVNFQVKEADTVVFEQSVPVINPRIPAKLAVNNLSAGKLYSYSVTSPDGVVRTGSFKTAAAAGGTPAVHFGVTGDWRGELAPYPAVKNVPSKALDFFVKLGDTIYADVSSPAVTGQARSLKDFQLKHKEVYTRHDGLNTLARLQRHVSTFSMIDDHEVTNDFAGGAPAASDARFGETTGLINQTALYNNGLQAFTQYNAIADNRYPIVGDNLTDGRPDLYRAQRYGSTAAVYMLDARSFRDQELPGVTDITSPTQIGNFVAQSFDVGKATTRTLLGKKQLERLKADLLAAQSDQVIWKFVMVPEPIQNLGVLAASDRFEGYASERSELLGFIDENSIKNVVFVTADIHGTLINDLTYQRREDVIKAILATGNPLAAPQIKTSAFEISTGSVAYSPGFGDSIIGLLSAIPNGDLLLAQLFAAVGVNNVTEFNALPMGVRNAAMEGFINSQLSAMGYTPLGLEGNDLIAAKSIKGTNASVFSFGWTRFDIRPDNHALKITTYGIAPYTTQDLKNNPAEVVSRNPEIISQFQIIPKP
ncbi:MAG: alkaline phosphatase D family protein [Methylovulum sp.]|nr:alkaline phosphatase D family protein [Methylovulum sp.]